MQTDLPDPVVPAIIKWGIAVKSPTIACPEIFLPKAIGKLIPFFLNFSSAIISLKKTSSLTWLGISIPTVFFPGIVATLVERELVFLAMSSERLIILETLIPGAGSNSYKVTTGPWLIFLIFPLTPKSKKIFSKNPGLVFLLSKFSDLEYFFEAFFK